MSNLNKIKKEKIQNMLDEILNENVSVESFQEISARSLENAEYEKINRELLDYYNSKNSGVDFQEELKRHLKSMSYDKVVSKLENEELDINEEEKEVSNELGGVDKATLEKASEKVEERKKEEQEKSPSENETFDLRAELMKQVYIEEFKKYENTLYNLKQYQIGKDELTVGDKEGTELVLHENYLKNLEKNYIAYAGTHNLEEKVLSDDPEIGKMKENLNERLGKAQNESQDRINKKIERIEKLSEQKQEIVRKINKILNRKDNVPLNESDQKQLDDYQEDYKKITYKIREESPTLEEYTKQIQIENENRNLAEKYGNTPYNSDIIAGSYVEVGKKIENKEDVDGTAENKVHEIVNKEDFNIAEKVYECLENARVLINQGIYDKAEEALQSAELPLNLKKNEVIESEKQKSKDSNEKLDKKMDKEQEKNKNYVKESEKQKSKDSNEELSETEFWKRSSLQSEEITRKDKLNERLRIADEKFKEIYPNWNKENDKKLEDIAKQRQINY